MVVYGFLALVGAIRLIIALVLLQIAAKKNMPNLRWLAWGFITTVLAIPFTAQPYVPFIDKAIAYVTYLCFAVFVHQTFYRGRRSPFVPFWAASTLLFVALFWTTGSFMYETTGVAFPQNLFLARPPYPGADGGVPMGTMELIDSFLYGSMQLAIWLWQAVAAFQAYRTIAQDKYVDDWIKSRYQLMVTYSCLQSLVGLAMMSRFLVSDAVTEVVALLVIVTTVMQYLVWAMPGWYNKWLNRNFRVPEEVS